MNVKGCLSLMNINNIESQIILYSEDANAATAGER